MNIAALLREISGTLGDAGIEDARIDAEIILAHVLGESRGRVQALALMDGAIAEQDRDRARSLAEERARRVPLQHLTGRAPFRTLELAVGPGVFIPRPETEMVAGLAIEELRSAPVGAVPVAVDLCTGSGAIALAIATEVPGSRVVAIERSVEAHAWATRNVERFGGGRVELVLGDVAACDIDVIADVVVSNPPYVPSGMVPRDAEVRDHDPAAALYSGEDGLDLIRIISRRASAILKEGGLLVLEHAEQQGAEIRRLLEADGWIDTATHLDLTGRDRATTARRE